MAKIKDAMFDEENFKNEELDGQYVSSDDAKKQARKSTGVKVSIKDFNAQEKCLRCGIMNGDSEICSKCEHYKHCKVCEVVMRHEPYIFYEYVYKVKGGEKFFEEYTKLYQPTKFESHVKGTCTDCLGFEEGIKDECFSCGSEFNNSVRTYKLRGNICPACINLVNLRLNNHAKLIRFSREMGQSENWEDLKAYLYPRG